MNLLLFMVAAVFASDVLVLTDENIEDELLKYDKMLVEFYAPWCGHCKKLEPEYEKAATKLKEMGIKTVLAKVDATIHKNSAKRYGVRGYPTLKYFVNDKPSDYGGGRTADGIVAWLKKRSQPALVPLKDVKEIEEFAKSDRLVLVGFYKEGSDEAKALGTFADSETDNYSFGLVTNPNIAAAMKVDIGQAVLYREMGMEEEKRTFDIPQVTMKEGLDISKFLMDEGFPLLAEMGPENYRLYIKRALPMAWVAVDLKDKELPTIKTFIKETAKKFKGEVSFVYVDGVKYAEMMKSIGLIKLPSMMIKTIPTQGEAELKYRLDKDLTAESCEEFFEAYKEKKLEPYLKSEEEPKEQKGPVIVAVGSSLNKLVNSDKGVLVEYYAPWCGHCKKLAPEYELAAEKLSPFKDVVIAKIDATANDIAIETVRSYPTLVWYPVGYPKEAKRTYSAGRSAQAIIDWVVKQAKLELDADMKEKLDLGKKVLKYTMKGEKKAAEDKIKAAEKEAAKEGEEKAKTEL